MNSKNYILLCFFLSGCMLFIFSCQPNEGNHNTWSVYRGDASNTAYSGLDQINKENVSQLQVAWTYHTGDADAGNHSTIQCNPIIANGMMYVTSPKLKLIAIMGLH